MKHDDYQWITCTDHVQVHSRPKQKNIISCEVIDVEIASVESNHFLFHSVETCNKACPTDQHLPADPPYLKCPFNGERSAIEKILRPTHEGDVNKLWNIIEKLSIDIVSGEAQPSPIADRDNKDIFFVLKTLDRIIVDRFDSFNDISKVISFQSALEGGACTAEQENRDAFQKASAYSATDEDCFCDLHPVVRVQVLFQNDHNVRSSIVNGRKRSLLLYKHLLNVDHVVENAHGHVGFCASYFSLVDDIGAERNTSISDHSCPPTPQHAMAKLVFIVEILNVNASLNVTARSKMKQESDMREEPLSVGHV